MINNRECEFGFQVSKYKKGDEIHPILYADRDVEIWSKYGINIQVFAQENEIIIPLIDSDNHGSGHLDKFLSDLKNKADKKKVFLQM